MIGDWSAPSGEIEGRLDMLVHHQQLVILRRLLDVDCLRDASCSSVLLIGDGYVVVLHSQGELLS